MQAVLKFMGRHSTLCRLCIGLALLTLLLGSVARPQMMGGSMITFGQIDSGAFGAPAKVTVGLLPASADTVSVQYATRDGTAVAGTDYQATTGTIVFAAGETSKTIEVASLPSGVSCYAWLDLSNPVNATISPDPPTAKVPFMGSGGGGTTPTVQFAQNIYSVGESAGSVNITVTLSAASASTVTVLYATSDGTATAPGDYVATNGMLTFNPGETTKSFSVTIVNDNIPEPSESVNLTLSAPSGATLGSQGTATLTIIDDDLSGPSVGFSQPGFWAFKTDGVATISVTVSPAPSSPVTVEYTTQDGTGQNAATAPGDYTSVSGTLSFAAGETVKTFQVTLICNTTPQADKSLQLVLSNPTNASLGLSPAGLCIQDAMPTFALQQVTYSGTDNFFEISADTGSQSLYSGPHWLDNNLNGNATDDGDHAYPVGFVRNTTMQLAAKLVVTTPAPVVGWLLVQGTTYANGKTQETPINVNGTLVMVPATPMDSALPNQIDYIDSLEVSWQTSFDAGATWSIRGRSRNRVYITWAFPLCRVFHTTVAIGCINAKGETQEQSAFDKMWLAFAGKKVQGYESGQPLVYYKTWTSKANNPKYTTTAGVLKNSEGDCVGFSQLFADCILNQGSNTVQIKAVEPKDHTELLVIKTWMPLILPKDSWTKTNTDYPFPGYQFVNVAKDANNFQVNNAYVWIHEEVHDEQGLDGQNNPNPPSIFPDHWVGLVSNTTTGKLYDPSYGNTYKDLADMDNQVIAYYGWIVLTDKRAIVLRASDGQGLVWKDQISVDNYLTFLNVPFFPDSLPDATVGAAYSQTIAARVNTGPATNFSITDGALPPGLALSTGGVLSGVPTTAGTFTFAVSADDTNPAAGPYVATQQYTLVVGP